MMDIKNTMDRYGLLAISLHWLMALLILGLLALGLYMVDLPISLEKLKLYGWHKEFGILVLILFGIRLVWHLINITPCLNLPWYEKLAARLVHGAFYFLMLAMPLSGWLMTSAAGLAPSFFGLFTLPNLVEVNPDLMKLFQQVHKYLAYALIGLIVLHSLAALKHHFIDNDDILRRMIS